MKRSFRSLAAVLSLALTLTACGNVQTPTNETQNPQSAGSAQTQSVKDDSGETAEAGKYDDFAYWKEGSPVVESIKEFVKNATDESSPNFIPKADRIVTFDWDGTLYAELNPTYFEWAMLEYRLVEDSSYAAPPEMRQFGLELREGMNVRKFASDAETYQARYSASAFSGMTLEEYKDYVRMFMAKDSEGFENLKYGEGWYQPMISVVKYLYDNDFKIYICSGSNRHLIRTVVEGSPLEEYIPSENIIGTDSTILAEHQGNTDGYEYSYSEDDALIFGGQLVYKNLNMNKVSSITNEIGKIPVLSFGNSGSDIAMCELAQQSPYGGKAYMLLCDNVEQDYGNLEKAANFKAKCEEHNFTTISMNDDFEQIYQDGTIISKPTEETAETETAEEAETQAAEETAANAA